MTIDSAAAILLETPLSRFELYQIRFLAFIYIYSLSISMSGLIIVSGDPQDYPNCFAKSSCRYVDSCPWYSGPGRVSVSVSLFDIVVQQLILSAI